MEYPSKLIEKAVEEIAKLPSIGKKTALRLVLHLLKQPQDTTSKLSEALTQVRNQIQYCRTCHMIADEDICVYCQSHFRDSTTLCVVEDSPDVLAILNTGQYNGLFHVLGGRISPLDGIGPSQLHIHTLMERLEHNRVKEVVLALSATMEGDTTSFYISKIIKEKKIKVTSIARGIPVGSEIEYADELTLGKSILMRNLFED